jgi:hypothetical protein
LVSYPTKREFETVFTRVNLSVVLKESRLGVLENKMLRKMSDEVLEK